MGKHKITMLTFVASKNSGNSLGDKKRNADIDECVGGHGLLLRSMLPKF